MNRNNIFDRKGKGMCLIANLIAKCNKLNGTYVYLFALNRFESYKLIFKYHSKVCKIRYIKYVLWLELFIKQNRDKNLIS